MKNVSAKMNNTCITFLASLPC
uniref:Uncharacterized protein n=1 Tax=Anguilla anguilla TaxID=7936 RepID=A0A0E9XYE2_ANGAN